MVAGRFFARASLLAMAAAALLNAGPAAAQPIVDSTLTWRGYNRTSTTEVRLYPGPPGAERRPHTIVLREVAANRGRSTVDDLRYLADLIGRRLGIDPVAATWVVHWGPFSYAGAGADDRDLLLRATFRRTSSGRLSSPYWRVVSRNDVRALTDRRWSP
jgi:hypothetical protein